jgi:hypothetical protein
MKISTQAIFRGASFSLQDVKRTEAQTAVVCAWSLKRKRQDLPEFSQSVAGSENHENEDDTQKHNDIVYGITLMAVREYPRGYAKQ